MASNLVAAIDGVLVKVANEVRQLFAGASVPDAADADHVKMLTDRGLLVEAEDQGAPVEDHSDAPAAPDAAAAGASTDSAPKGK